MPDYSVNDAKAEISRLRGQVQSLISDRVSPALSNAADTMGGYADQARDYAGQARDMAHDQADVLSDQVRESPLAAIMIAAGIGYLLGRITR